MVNMNTPNPQIKTIPSLSETFELQDGVRVFNLVNCLRWLDTAGKSHFGENFKIHRQDVPLIRKLLLYFIQDAESCDKHEIQLNKGIMLTGPVGTGKTSLMTLMRYFCYQHQRHNLKSCREISYEFSQTGYQIIQKYAGLPPFPTQTTCFDDLGTEHALKFYGNSCNIMAEILLSRYDQFVAHGILTHLTTNLSASEIENHYGTRVRSRLREMVNLLSFNSSTPDKR